VRKIWGWYRHPWRTYRAWPRWAQITTGVLVVIVVIAAATGGSKKSPQAPASPRVATVGRAAAKADTRTKASIGLALKVIASDYQVFHNYALETAVTLGNRDRRLRGIPSLTAAGNGKRFSVSIRSASGTTFTVRGAGLKLQRTCLPAGRACPNGHWAGSELLKLPKVPVVTAAEKAKVRTILTQSVDHYQQLYNEGKQALGTTQYATAQAGVAAFNDPNSAATRFGAYRHTSKVQTDESYLNAFEKADRVYTAANEPKAISSWRDDMGNLTGDLYAWVDLAVSWQIKEKSTGQLEAAEHKIDNDFAAASRDVARTVAGH
jgi:hypothetical protein